MSKNAGFQNLEELVSRNVWKGDGRTVVMGVVTKSFLPLALNFLCSLRTIPYPPKVILWAADYDCNYYFNFIYYYYYLLFIVILLFTFFYFQVYNFVNRKCKYYVNKNNLFTFFLFTKCNEK